MHTPTDPVAEPAGPAEPTTPAEHAARVSAERIIMPLFLASLSMGFAVVLLLYFIMRARAPAWPPPGTPPLPAGLWLSTAFIVCSSLTMHWALRSARAGRPVALRAATLATLLLAVGFLASQTVNWLLALAAKMPPGLNMYALTFYLLTGLHAAHVTAGLVPLTWVTVKSFRGRYTPATSSGVRLCAVFWHFVDVVWLILFGTLMLAG